MKPALTQRAVSGNIFSQFTFHFATGVKLHLLVTSCLFYAVVDNDLRDIIKQLALITFFREYSKSHSDLSLFLSMTIKTGNGD